MHIAMETELYLLETLLLTKKMCAGSTTDEIWVNTEACSVTSEPSQQQQIHFVL